MQTPQRNLLTNPMKEETNKKCPKTYKTPSRKQKGVPLVHQAPNLDSAQAEDCKLEEKEASKGDNIKLAAALATIKGDEDLVE